MKIKYREIQTVCQGVAGVSNVAFLYIFTVNDSIHLCKTVAAPSGHALNGHTSR